MPLWEVDALDVDIREFALMGDISFGWVCCIANKVARGVASMALRGVLSLNWVSSPPSLFVHIHIYISHFFLRESAF